MPCLGTMNGLHRTLWYAAFLPGRWDSQPQIVLYVLLSICRVAVDTLQLAAWTESPLLFVVPRTMLLLPVVLFV